MNDWISCATCNTIYEYDAVRQTAECPYCKKRREERRNEARKRRPPTPERATSDRAAELPQEQRRPA